MKQFRKKYNSFAASVFLFAYLLLLTENFFHVHHYDISVKDVPISLNYLEPNNDPFTLGTSFCFLEFICNTINLDNFAAKDIVFFTTAFNYSEKTIPGQISNLNPNPQNLRAPPAASFL
jgi:hypothetical protein